MTHAIKTYSDTQVNNDDYNYDDPELNPDYDTDFEDDGLDAPNYEDEFIPSEDEPPAPMSGDEIRTRIIELETLLNQNTDLKSSEKSKIRSELKALRSAINSAMGLSSASREAKLGEIQSKMADLEATINSTNIDDPDNNGGGLTSELEAMKERIEDDEKIPSDIKRELKGEIDKLIAKSDLDLSEVKEENIREKMEEIEGKIEEARSITDGAKNLEEEVTGKTAQEIQEIATSKGIDLNDLPKPPTAEVMEFLVELIPDLKAALQTAKDAVAAKKKTDDDMVTAAAAKSRANAVSTTDVDQDRQGLAEFIYLLNAQTHTDSSSEKMADAYNKFTTLLADKLKLLYPDVSISAVGNSFDDADLINFDNQKIDVLSNTEGTIISNTSLTADAELALPQMVTLEFDWEGDGDYEDADNGNTLRWLQERGYPTHAYD